MSIRHFAETAQQTETDHMPSLSQSVTCTTTNGEFLADVIAGLRLPQKRLPCKYFYDERGSELFEEICRLPEYYPTRTELSIMQTHAGDMAEAIGTCVTLMELGSGASLKTRYLLDELDPGRYVPIDISADALEGAVCALEDDYPELTIDPDCSDFTQGLDAQHHEGPVTVYFPGSTIGNLEDHEAEQLLEHVAAAIGGDGRFLLGIDLQKDLKTLLPAYDDAQGVTAEFNLNMLRRINRELDADFDLDGFTHQALYNADRHRVEIYLRSESHQRVSIDEAVFDFARGETICTEYSHKYTVSGMTQLAREAGLVVEDVWTDVNRLFAVLLFSAG
jgi:L-histidine Nalpha-methyltransferase